MILVTGANGQLGLAIRHAHVFGQASYMFVALGEKLGGPLSIVDSGEGFNAPVQQRAMMFKSTMADAGAPESDIDTRRIKITSNVHVVFEIK